MATKMDIEVDASPECVSRMIEGRKKSTKPDFTVTAAKVLQLQDEFLVVAWETQSAGFGTVSIYKDTDGTYRCGNETMDRRFLKSVFSKLLDEIPLQD